MPDKDSGDEGKASEEAIDGPELGGSASVSGNRYDGERRPFLQVPQA